MAEESGKSHARPLREAIDEIRIKAPTRGNRRLEVLMDGGVRRGTDVMRALALGARAVLAGRAPLWGLAARGEEGARTVLELLRDEIELAQVLLGCPTPDDVTRAHVMRRPV